MLFLFFAERLDIPARVLAFRSEARFVRFVKRLVDLFLRRGVCTGAAFLRRRPLRVFFPLY
jgi:hypothetical protein